MFVFQGAMKTRLAGTRGRRDAAPRARTRRRGGRRSARWRCRAGGRARPPRRRRGGRAPECRRRAPRRGRRRLQASVPPARRDREVLRADAGDDRRGRRAARPPEPSASRRAAPPPRRRRRMRPGRKFIGRRADEAGDEDGGRPAIDLHRRADLLGDARVHHHQPVGKRHRLDLVVRHVEAGDAEARLQPLDLDAHLRPELGVEIGQRLVEEEDGRLAHDGAAHGDALALAAGKLPRLAVEERRELQERGRLAAPWRRSPPSRGRGCGGRRRCCRRRSYADRARSSGTPWRCRGPSARAR